MPDTIDDFEPEPDDHADALEIGQRIYDRMRDTLIDAAAASVAFQDDKDQLNELRLAMGRNPKHFIKAVERFPELFDAETTTGDIWEILGAVALSRIKNDSLAIEMYENWIGDGSLSLDDLKACIKHANGTRERKPTLAEQCAGIVRNWRNIALMDKVVEETRHKCADELAALPEVAKVLESKDVARAK